MNLIIEQIEKLKSENKINIFWLGGAGFLIVYGRNTIAIDPYFSDACHDKDDKFKRIVPSPMSAADLILDYVICTHDHGDHFDFGSIHALLDNNITKLIGPDSVYKSALQLGIKEDKIDLLNRNQSKTYNIFTIETVMADHGFLSQDALGIIIRINGKTIYFTGDTCFNSSLFEQVIKKGEIDLLLLPINGAFGNLDASEAAKVVSIINPKIAVPCHFWLFTEHGGDPGLFIKFCAEEKTDARVKVLAIGEGLEIGL